MFEAKLTEIQAKLAEAETRNQRALSMAQQTKAGHVYIISNVGSFGEDMFKVGMTRRLEPLDRVRELGDASVPFSFDVHAMIWSKDAQPWKTSCINASCMPKSIRSTRARNSSGYRWPTYGNTLKPWALRPVGP